MSELERERRQFLLTPLTLRLAQLSLTIFRSQPLITDEQKRALRPFFIIGSGRSGTTLLRTILNRHPVVAIPPEAYGLVNSLKKYLRYNGLDWPDLVNVVLGEFAAHDSFRFWETDIFALASDLQRAPKQDRSLALILDAVYGAYVERHHPGATVWGDKTPFNTLRLKWLHRTFPQARYVEMLRDGRDVVSSYLQAGLAPSLEAACDRWNRSLDAAARFRRKASPDRFISVRYEELVRRPQQESQRVCTFLGIDFHSEMIEAGGTHLGDDALEHLKNVRNPITDASVGKWKKELSAGQQRLALRFLRKRLLENGYSLESD